jgi:vacuolar-type H+-ATPase subunit F/Vma7
MARLAVLGEEVAVQGYALAGAVVLPAEDAAAVRAAWAQLPDDVAVVVLTPAAARALPEEATTALRPLTVVMPP